MNEIDDISFLNRWVAVNNSTKESSLSDIPFAISFTATFTLLFNDDINNRIGQFLGIYFKV